MKVETKVLSDARLSIQVMENDGTPVATRELSREEAVDLFARWSLVFIPSTGHNQVTLGGSSKDILIALADAAKPRTPKRVPQQRGATNITHNS